MQALDNLGAEATSTKEQALTALGALNAAVETGIGDMVAIDYTKPTPETPEGAGFVAPTNATEAPDFSALGPTSPPFPDAPTVGSLGTPGSAPTVPTAYVVPTATDLLIEAATFNAIYNRKAARLARLGVKAERDAVERAGRLGVGVVSAALTLGQKEAEEKTRLDTSDVANDQEIAEGTWLREDVKTLHGMHIQNWPLRPRLSLDSYQAEEQLTIDAFRAQETAGTAGYQAIVSGLATAYDAEVKWAIGYLQAESDRYRTEIQRFSAEVGEQNGRLEWTKYQSMTDLEAADKATKYAIEKAQYILDTSRETAQVTAQIIGTLASAIYTAADYGLSGSGSQSVSESV